MSEKLTEKELRALISLLDDQDSEVAAHVEQKILELGNEIIPFLESEWEANIQPEAQKRLEDIIHFIQFEHLKNELIRWKQSENQDLIDGAWLICTYQYPDVELEKVKAAVDQLYYEAWTGFSTEMRPIDQVKTLNNVFFNKLKFAPNTKNFHSPGNSMINVVMDTRKGNPISLSVIYILLAEKLKIPVFGVNLPNLFIMTYKSDEIQFYINTFNRGLIFQKEDIDNYLNNISMVPREEFYQPTTSVEIIKRMLRNLIMSFEKMGEHFKVDEIKQLLATIQDPGDPPV